MKKPYEHRNLFNNINLFMDIHKLTSVSIWTPKKNERNEYVKWLSQAVVEIIGCPVYVITNKEKKYKNIEGVTITNNAPPNTLVLTMGVHLVKELDTCNLKYQCFVFDIQKFRNKKKGFGVISYIVDEDYKEWLTNQISEYINEKHHITKEELFKNCKFLPIPDENV